MADATVRMEIESRWDEVRPGVAATWPQLTRADLNRIQGTWDEVVTAVKLSSGEALATIEGKLEQVVIETRRAA